MYVHCVAYTLLKSNARAASIVGDEFYHWISKFCLFCPLASLTKLSDSSNLTVSTDNKLGSTCDTNEENFFDRIQNIVVKGEKAGYHQNQHFDSAIGPGSIIFADVLKPFFHRAGLNITHYFLVVICSCKQIDR